MNQKRLLTAVNTLWLGAIDGLLVGLALEAGRVTYLNYQMSLAAREYSETKLWADFTSARWELLTPLVTMVVFAAIAYVVDQWLISRPRLLLSLWFAFGAVALALGFFMATSNADLFSLLWLAGLVAIILLVHWLWRNHPDSISLLWAVNGVSAVIAVALGVQLVGLFFHWRDLRRPFIWLICLVSVIAISAVFGAIVRFILNRVSGRKVKEAGA
ncbi:MAG: hypothetical protein ACXWID_18705 [Pyrinomonadaceae bacterium]